MGTKQKINQYRERLDRTLASPKLTNLESLKALVKRQILQSSGQEIQGCSETVIEKRTAEVSNFLDMLRSASMNGSEESKSLETASQQEWKLKQDNEEFRVMYREGPQGTPFHTLLVEGYVDGPLDVCKIKPKQLKQFDLHLTSMSFDSLRALQVNKTSSPNHNFQITFASYCRLMHLVGVGPLQEMVASVDDPNFQNSLLQLFAEGSDWGTNIFSEVSWPLSTREAIIHYFLFEYLEDDLVVVLLNTVSDTGNINISTHGFTNEAIPEAKDVVRIDVVGGFALQKVTPERSYFRTIANMDIKLDFVPPSLINFIARQLIGNGFRLYQKAVSSTFTSDEDFSKALRDSLYTRIHEALYSTNQSIGVLEEKELNSESSHLPIEYETINNLDELEKEHKKDLEEKELKSDLSNLSEEQKAANNSDDLEVTDQKVNCDYHAVEYPLKDVRVAGTTAICEIEELKSEESKHFKEQILIEKVMERSPVGGKRNISSEVEQALGTLEKVISMVREYGFNTQMQSSNEFGGERTPKVKNAVKDSKSLEDEGVCSRLEAHVEVEKEVEQTSSQESVKNSSSIENARQGGSNSFSKEANHNRIAPAASPEQEFSVPCDTNTNQVDSSSAKDGPTQISISNHITRNTKDSNGVHENGLNGGKKLSKQKSQWLCCFGPIS